MAAWVRTREWFLACMDPEMGLEVEVEGELFATLVARVRLLTLMKWDKQEINRDLG